MELDLVSAPGTMHQAHGTRHQATTLHQDAGTSCYFYQDADASYYFYQDAGASCYSTTTRTLLFHQDAGWRRQLLYEHFYLSVAVLLKLCLPILCVRLLSQPRFKASHLWHISSLPRLTPSLLLYQVSIPMSTKNSCRAISMIIHLAGIGSIEGVRSNKARNVQRESYADLVLSPRAYYGGAHYRRA